MLYDATQVEHIKSMRTGFFQETM